MHSVTTANDALTASCVTTTAVSPGDPAPRTTTGTSDVYIHKCANVTGRAGLANPISIMLNKDKPGAPDVLTTAHFYKSSIGRLQRKVEEGAVIIEAGDFAAVACWEPPTATEKLYKDIPSQGHSKYYMDWMADIEVEKHKLFNGGKYWKLSLMARDPDRKDKGVVRAVVEPYLELSKKEKTPLWLEASSTRARAVYEYFGFKVVKELRLGVGKYDENGDVVEGGPGVSSWLMVYNWPIG